MTKELEARVGALEEQMKELHNVFGSGDPVGEAQRVIGRRKAALAAVNNPAKLTDAKIKEIAADDGTDSDENSANRQVTEALKADRAQAKTKDTETPKHQPGNNAQRGK